MKKLSLVCLIFIYEFVCADDQKLNIIVENCKSCHNLNKNVTTHIPDISNLDRDMFISLMIDYKEDKKEENQVMHRISKVLTNDDIIGIADLIYD